MLTPFKQSWIYLRKRFGYKIYIYIAIILYSIVFSAIMLSAHYAFRTYAWDLGIFNQAFWNTLHGRLFDYTSESVYTTTGNFLGVHFGPILFLILPLYAAFPYPELLIVTSPIIVALGAIPVYELARLILKNDRVALLLGVSYLLYPPLQGAIISGFSLEIIALPIFLFIVYYLIRGDFAKLSLAFILGLATHEASAFVIAFIGLYGAWHYRSLRSKGFQASVIITTMSIVYYVFAQNIRVFLGWTQQPSLWHEWAIIGAESPSSVPFQVIMNPIGALNSLAFDAIAKVVFLLMFLIPLAFLPMVGVSALLPTLPYLFLGLFSSYPGYYSIGSHYGAFLVPFFFVALILGMAKLEKIPRFRVSTMRTAKVVFVLSLVSLVAILPTTYVDYVSFDSGDAHGRILFEALSMIPQNASVLTQNNIFPHVSGRANAYTIPSPNWSKEYQRIANETLQNLRKVEIDYVLIDLKSEPYSASSGTLILNEFVLKWNNYDKIVDQDGVMLFRLRT
ncbi:MAG TPA: DUF2079 domain-containing protein [Acidobacteriota bacterium]|nr:DUF2079 domain-containing protein [Acidobacteriota bacterium]